MAFVYSALFSRVRLRDGRPAKDTGPAPPGGALTHSSAVATAWSVQFCFQPQAIYF